MNKFCQNNFHQGYDKIYYYLFNSSSELNCRMKFGVYLPPQAESAPVPVIYFLSGVAADESHFIEKYGAQKYAAEHGIILVTSDTSPRGDDVIDHVEIGIGKGASFYVDATEDPWKKNYRMYSYITKELPELIMEKFPVESGRQSIMGHR